MKKLDSFHPEQILSPQAIKDTDYGGTCPFQALRNIKKRFQQRKKGQFTGLKTALVLQGGGMRGVFGAGVCCALQELGYTEGFDEIYGASAGALNGAYFLSGQSAYGTTIYYQDINNKKFINLLRPAKKMDIDFLTGIIKEKKPLHIEKLKQSSTSLNVVLTRVSTGEAAVFKANSEEADLILSFLKATAAMPFVYDVPVNIQGTDYLDGGIASPIPITEAIEEGCTDILVVLTRPKDYTPSPSRGPLVRFLVEPHMKKYGKNFYHTFVTRYQNYAHRLSIIKGEKESVKAKVNILAIFPQKMLGIKRTTKKKRILKKAAMEGAKKTLALFGKSSPCPVEVFKFLPHPG